MVELYPFRFEPILKQKVWGGNNLSRLYGKSAGDHIPIGESWEISGVPGDVSILANGKQKGTDLNQLLQKLGPELVGRSVHKLFGNEFPLLVKLLDASDDLSIQVHPDDAMARERHNCSGKTEMWYILRSENGRLNTGFKRGINKQKYIEALQNKNLESILHFEHVEKGDSFFIPSGTVHAICKGVLLAEIQQTSDITYRIYDYNRSDLTGKPRQLHTEEALEAIHFEARAEKLGKKADGTLIDCPFFTTRHFEVKVNTTFDFEWLDSFVIWICTEGSSVLETANFSEEITPGQTVLMPAGLKHIKVKPAKYAAFLETFIRIA